MFGNIMCEVWSTLPQAILCVTAKSALRWSNKSEETWW